MNYDDIIHLKRPNSRFPHLGMDSRAAQFAPFAALTGYEDEIQEVERLTESKKELVEDSYEILNLKIHYLEAYLSSKPKVQISYFRKDQKKSGGQYLYRESIIQRIDFIYHKLYLEDGSIILMDDICILDSELFRGVFD